MEQIPIATGEFACGASLSALGPVTLPNERLLNELNVPKGKPRMRTLLQFPEIVPCMRASRRAGMGNLGDVGWRDVRIGRNRQRFIQSAAASFSS